MRDVDLKPQRKKKNSWPKPGDLLLVNGDTVVLGNNEFVVAPEFLDVSNDQSVSLLPDGVVMLLGYKPAYRLWQVDHRLILVLHENCVLHSMYTYTRSFFNESFSVISSV